MLLSLIIKTSLIKENGSGNGTVKYAPEIFLAVTK
jgi:hypothetical protein